MDSMDIEEEEDVLADNELVTNFRAVQRLKEI